ncbi:MAG: hypothetical protein GY801_51095 [bacterium]|nr:hypothetical protein [bacterium]
MLSVKEHVSQTIDTLTEDELKLVSEYLSFLKFQARTYKTLSQSESQLAELYAEASQDDRLLAEEGMADYAAGLREEDTR